MGPKCPHAYGQAPGCVLDRIDYWQAGSPGMAAGRVSLETIEGLRRALPWREFAREFLGWHEAPASAEVRIPVALWLAAVDELSRIDAERRPIFVVDSAPDGAWSSIAVAGARADGRTHVGIVRHGSGDGWVVDELRELFAKHGAQIAVDGASPAASLLAPLEAAGVPVRKLTLSEVAQACGSFSTQIKANPPKVLHRGDPLVERALKAAAVRIVGDGAWAWARKSSDGDITPLVAVTLAAWLHGEQPDYDVTTSVW